MCVNHVRTLVSGWTHLLPRLHTITISPSPQSIGHTSVSATVYLRMFWSEYLTRYGVEAVFAVMERVTIRQRPLLGLQLSVRVGVGPARLFI